MFGQALKYVRMTIIHSFPGLLNHLMHIIAKQVILILCSKCKTVEENHHESPLLKDKHTCCDLALNLLCGGDPLWCLSILDCLDSGVKFTLSLLFYCDITDYRINVGCLVYFIEMPVVSKSCAYFVICKACKCSCLSVSELWKEDVQESVRWKLAHITFLFQDVKQYYIQTSQSLEG